MNPRSASAAPFVRRSFARMALVGAALVLTACNNGDDRSVIERLGASGRQGPEEFATLPQKTLELPEDLTALPPPQPGTGSRTDLTPREDAIAALGGAGGGASSAADTALLVALGANQRDVDIRTTLREEDRVYRRNNRGQLLPRLFGRDGDSQIYEDFILDAEAELLRLRAQGIAVPQLPPSNF